jgi:hypothetical protein
VTVVVNGRSLRFALPERAAPSATSLVRRATFVFRHLRSLVIDERLASAPGNAVRTRYEIVAPDRLHYLLDTGTAGIVIGAQRWDRDSRSAPWQPSAQEPLRLPEPFWRSWRDASLLGSTRGSSSFPFSTRRFRPGSLCASTAGRCGRWTCA